MIDGISSWLVLARVDYPLSTLPLPNLMIELERKDDNGIIKNCTTLRVSVNGEGWRSEESFEQLSLFILMAESQDNTHTDYKISHGFRHQL